MGFKENLDQWLDERLMLSVFKKFAAKKVVPQHEQTIWYYFGGMAMFLLLVQIVTGLLLMVYYQPGIETSHASVAFITEKVAFGKLIRSMHSWSANLMVATIFIHMFCAYFMRAYRRPRELTWLTGFGLFALTLGLGFSGYLLPWDSLAFFATKVGLQIMNQTPVVGPILADLLRGGSEVGGATISRFFELHVIVLPLAMLGLVGAHLMLVQMHGMSTPHSYANKPKSLQKSIPFFEDFLYHDVFIWTLMMGGLVFLAWQWPWELGPQADPWASAPEGIKPEWYFMFMFQILKMLPAHIGPFEGEVCGIIAFGLAGAMWALVPFWEGINKWTQKLATVYGLLAVVVILWGTITGYMPPAEARLSGSGPAVSGAPVTSGADAASVFTQNCAACHSIGKGKLMGPDLKNVTQGRDREQLAAFIVDPSGSAMPKLPGLDMATAHMLLDYIDAESNPDAQKSKGSESTEAVAPITPQDIENGQKLFWGTKPFAKGGGACVACHSVNDPKMGNGGAMGPNLTHVSEKLGGATGLSAWLASVPSPTMKPIYTAQPLQPEEIKALSAYFGNLPKANTSKTPPAPSNQFFLFGFAGLVLAMVGIGVMYQERLRGVRAPLVNQSQQNKEE